MCRGTAATSEGQTKTVTLKPGCINWVCKICDRPVLLFNDDGRPQNKGTCAKCGTEYVSDSGIGRYWRDKLEAEKYLEWYLRRIAA